MKQGKLVLPTLLIVMILGVILPTSGQQPPAPKISLEPSTITVTVSTQFTLTVWIRDIPQGYSMRWYSYRITWDPKQAELVNVLDEDHGWQTGGDTGLGYIERLAGAPDAGITSDASWLRITFHCLTEGLATITIASPNGIDLYMIGSETPVGTNPTPFNALINQVEPALVGGNTMPTNKLEILTPYLALVGLIIVSAVYIVKKRKD